MSDSGAKPARTLLTPRLWLVVAVLAGYGLLVLLPVVQRKLGLFNEGRWFLDSYAILASSDAVQAGLDPAQPNPLDPLGRPHSYSGWWFGLGKLGLARADNFLLGGSFVLAFLAVALIGLRPVTRGEALASAALILSPPLLLAVNRANNDLVVFALVGAGLLLLRSSAPWRLAAFAVAVVLATGLKFYPLVALGALLVVRPARRALAAGAVAGLAGAVVLWSQWDYFTRAVIPAAGGFYTFGAPLLWRDLGWTGPGVVLLSLGVLLAAAVLLVGRKYTTGLADDAQPMGERAAFAAGALLLVACWLAGVSFAYRWVFALLLLPWLLRRRREGNPAARRALLLLFITLWMDGLICLGLNLTMVRLDDGVMTGGQRIWRLLTQPLVWGLMAMLAGWLLELGQAYWRELQREWTWPKELTPRRLLAGLVVFGLLGYVLVPRARSVLGIVDYGAWFLDSYAVLAASDAHRDGLDITQANSYDPLNRPHRYSDWWLGLAGLGLTRENNFLVGSIWVLAFLGAALLTLRPRSHAEAAWLALLVLSPSVLQGIVRANNDLVIFALLALALLARRLPGSWSWLLGLAAVVTATGLKFYPVAAGAMFLLVRPIKSMVVTVSVATVALGVTLWSVWPQLARGIFPIDPTVHVWGGRLLMQDLGLGAAYATPVILFVLAVAALWLGRGDRLRVSFAGENAPAFVLAAAVLLACFAAGLNYGYRWIFALWLGPWLWDSWRDADPLGRLALWLVPLALWQDGLLCAVVNLGLLKVPAAQFAELQHAWRLGTQPLTWLLMLLLAGWLGETVRTAVRERRAAA